MMDTYPATDFPDLDTSCPGCGAQWVGHAAAFACGSPLADCPAQLARDDEYLAEEWKAKETSAFMDLIDWQFGTSRRRRPTQAECDIMDAWEEEIDGTKGFNGAPIVVPVESHTNPIDIPF